MRAGICRRWAAVRGAQPGCADANERGFTMMEVVASMTLMMIFMAMFTGVLVQTFGAANKVASVVDSSSQINSAFIRLDKEIRYASAINPSGLGSDGNWYVEFLTTASGASQCTQLRVAGGILQQRTWVDPATTIPQWQALASGLVQPTTSVSPFTTRVAAGNQLSQRLSLSLAALSGTNKAASTSTTSITFTAMNSSALDSTTNDGSTKVCQTGVGRP